jgi:hypothetical protein
VLKCSYLALVSLDRRSACPAASSPRRPAHSSPTVSFQLLDEVFIRLLPIPAALGPEPSECLQVFWPPGDGARTDEDTPTTPDTRLKVGPEPMRTTSPTGARTDDHTQPDRSQAFPGILPPEANASDLEPACDPKPAVGSNNLRSPQGVARRLGLTTGPRILTEPTRQREHVTK